MKGKSAPIRSSQTISISNSLPESQDPNNVQYSRPSNSIPYSQGSNFVSYSQSSGRSAAEIPNRRGFQTEHGSPNGYQYTPRSTSYNGDTAALGQLAVQGAQNFYTGVQQAGQIFGFDFGR